jgi:hypothetical protein
MCGTSGLASSRPSSVHLICRIFLRRGDPVRNLVRIPVRNLVRTLVQNKVRSPIDCKGDQHGGYCGGFLIKGRLCFDRSPALPSLRNCKDTQHRVIAGAFLISGRFILCHFGHALLPQRQQWCSTQGPKFTLTLPRPRYWKWRERHHLKLDNPPKLRQPSLSCQLQCGVRKIRRRRKTKKDYRHSLFFFWAFRTSSQGCASCHCIY